MDNETLFNRVIIEDIFKDLPNYVFCKDKEFVYRLCNDQFIEYAGLRNYKDVIGKTDFDMPWGKTTAELYRREDREVMETGKPILSKEVQMQIPRLGNRTLLVSKRVLRDKNNNGVGILGIYIDITDRKRQEKELREAKEEAEKSNKIKRDFISNMEHDIRTPFVGIYGMIDILAQQEKDQEKKTILCEVALCAKELMDYCDGILDFSKIESESFPIVSKSFVLQKLIDSVITMEMIAAKHKHLKISLEYDNQLPSVVMGDSYRLKRILINLLSNAIKFTKKGGVKISVFLVKRDQKKRDIVVKFVVEDTGIGIPNDKKALIYERFTRVIPSNRGLYKGLGLGLRIVKQFVDELDGHIHLKSKLGEGSKFILFLPFKIPLSDEIIDEE